LLTFIHADEDVYEPRHVPASEVASLLARKGVGYVLLNACQSAAEGSPSSNIIRSMVQEGIEIAIGMAYKVLDSAAEIFVDAFYREVYRSGRSLWRAAQIAQFTIRIKNQRRTRYNSNVILEDWITPVLVSRAIPDQDIEDGEFPPTSPAAYKKVEMDIVGREVDILRLETDMSNKNGLSLAGPAGCGKSFLVQHLCWCWKATRFVDGCVVIDCSKRDSFVIPDIFSEITSGLSPTEPIVQNELLPFLKQHRFLVVIDKLEAAKAGGEAATKSQRADLRRFIRKIKRSLVLLVSRNEEDSLKSVSPTTYFLQNLEM